MIDTDTLQKRHDWKGDLDHRSEASKLDEQGVLLIIVALDPMFSASCVQEEQ